MKEDIKLKLKKFIIWLVFGFIILFIFRFMYGYTLKFDNVNNQTEFFENISNSKRNYASKEYKVKQYDASQPNVKVDQKYEKIAEIKSITTNFENDELVSRNNIEKYNALIQFEQKSGNKGNRKLDLLIGVPPENFDSLYEQLIKIGKVQGKQITKKDKTNEYKELNAKKISLEKIRTSLIDLKSKGGKIEEYMDLENRILEIEQQLQELGVSLGDFDDENEFCTVQFSIKEKKEVKIGVMHRVKVALEWTVKIYLKIFMTLFFVVLFAYFLLVIIEKLKIIEKQINRKS